MRRALLSSLVLALLTTAPARADTTVVDGAGFGHGVGLSQYGAYGFAQHGKSWKKIAKHYFAGTEMSSISPGKVRVLLQASRTPDASFTGAKRIGPEKLDPDRNYVVSRDGESSVVVRSAGGESVGRFRDAVKAKPTGTAVRLFDTAINGVSNGTYRGKLEFRPGLSGGVTTINVVDLEDYLRGVLPNEMPASWPADALKAQAVVARSYALASASRGATFDHYPDQRSQVYNGAGSESRSTDHAVESTAGRVLTYDGEIAQTFFFSTSGGRTEDVENSFYGSPVPYLKSVEDPYDDGAPLHRWTRTFSQSEMESKLAGYFSGDFERVEVLKRGSSPRIVSARIHGARGSTVVRGTTLQYRLGLPDSWADFERR